MRPYEFWHPRLFEAPYYVYLLWRCLRRGLPPMHIAKANWALDHGELGLGSKFSTQEAFAQDRFLPSILICPEPSTDPVTRATEFAKAHGFPLILKPDIGAVGKGIVKVSDLQVLQRHMRELVAPHILQVFTPWPEEYGVFFTRRRGQSHISGINKKHFPEVLGNGTDTIATLATRHYRYTAHWSLFLRYIDTERIPARGERVRLSFIGSHTMGCKFTDDSHLVTPALESAMRELCDSQPGFNFGRLDVKAADEAAFQRGEFVVIEVNGIASLPTHMFDPDHSLRQAYRIFLAHGRELVDIANEHRARPMALDSPATLWRKATANHKLLNRIHDAARSSDQDSPA